MGVVAWVAKSSVRAAMFKFNSSNVRGLAVGGKARVHELAKELGVTSTEILDRLHADGKFVKSASSTVEAPVARRLRESFPPAAAGEKKTAAEAQRHQSSATRAQKEAARLKRKPRFQPDDVLGISARGGRPHRPRSTSDNQRAAIPLIKKQALKPEARAGRSVPVRPVETPGGQHAARFPRTRRVGLPQIAVNLDAEAVADIVASDSANDNDTKAIATCLYEIAPATSGAYGYLTWRYAATRAARMESAVGAAGEDLVALAIVIDHEKQLLKDLVRTHGSILTKASLAKLGLKKEFQGLIDADATGNSAADELRRTRASFSFLRRAVLLTVASSGNDEQLWGMLDRIRPPAIDRLPETSPQLERAIRRLNGFIAAVAELLSTDDASLADFFLRSRRQLIALQLKRYDFLCRFRDGFNGLHRASRRTSDLEFEILPQGEQLRAFLGEIRRSKMYSGYRVDERRLTVLEDLQARFGAERCTWHRGHSHADGIGSNYLVLAIGSANGSGENAVAVSPLAGRHATYVVRHDWAEADWRILLAHPKFEARLRGARKLLFTAGADGIDQYNAMRDKIINLLECHP